MKRLLDLVGLSIGGWLGWMLGAWVSIFTAFLLSMVGTGFGLYLARKLTRGLLP